MCICKVGYANVINKEKDKMEENTKSITIVEEYCTYQQKSQLIAFLLEFFFWLFAFGHYYAGRIIFATVKMSVMLIIPCLVKCFKLLTKDSQNNTNTLSIRGFTEKDGTLQVNRMMHQNFEQDTGFRCSEMLYTAYSISCALWIIIDLIIFGFNGYNDGNNMPLYNW